jgi:hypothetical protein
MESKLNVVSTEDEKYEFVIMAASGKLTFEEIKDWITSSVQPDKPQKT